MSAHPCHVLTPTASTAIARERLTSPMKRSGPAVGSFASNFVRATSAAPASASRGAHRASDARQAASQLVASTLILPVLQQMHDSGLIDPDSPFAPTAADDRFGPLLDQEIADRMTKAANFPLIEQIIARYPGLSGAATRVASTRFPAGAIDVHA